MDKNLLSRLRKQIEWKSAVKVLLPAVLLVWAWQRGFAVIPLICFVAALSWGYFTESQERKQFRASFWLTALTTLVGLYMLSGSTALVIALITLFAAAVAMELSFFRFLFTNRSAVYGIYHLALIFATFLIFFASSLQWLSLIYAVLAITLVLQEYFTLEGAHHRMRVVLLSVGAGFLVSEVALLTRTLPLGTVNAAAFMALITLLTRDAIKAHFEGKLSLASVLRGIAIFLFVSVIIFGLSMWRV